MEVKISVVIITLNEEKNISRCLDSVVDIADEILVVDSFSYDKTEEICKEYAVKFHQHKFESYIGQKNYALSLSKYFHVLSLDADEALSEELISSIKKTKQNWKADGYSMNRLANYCGQWIKHSGWYPDKKLRLFDKRKAQWGGVNPHDKIILQNDCTELQLNGDLHHYTYYTIDEHITQANKFSTIAANEIVNLNKKISIFNIFTKSIAKFLRNYFFKLGFLDGFYGFMICEITAFETFLKYAKAYKLNSASHGVNSIKKH
ncbi:MAG: glycosyltransferase family 2 protein [Bacteroidales bacterium]|nr:glycosyltransferase family 2 protein [Bacteroidales bacterium]